MHLVKVIQMVCCFVTDVCPPICMGTAMNDQLFCGLALLPKLMCEY